MPWLLALTMGFAATALAAQDPVPTPAPTGATTGARPQQPTRSPSSTAQQPVPQRWTPFTDSLGQALRLTPEQMGRVTQVDLRFRQQYDAMGNTPWNDPRYPALQDQRNMEVRGILEQDQYKQWLEMNRPVTPDERAVPAPPPPPPTSTPTPP